MGISKKTAVVYIDGLNLYRQRLVSDPQLKWLDPLALARVLLPTHEIIGIRYFSTRIKPPLLDPQAPSRQVLYWRALATLGKLLTLHEGTMRVDKRWMPVVPLEVGLDGNLVKVRVQKIEEKGSDVALATYMTLDAARRVADMYVLVSSDSDFAPTLTLLREELGAGTALFSPIETPSRSLLGAQPHIVKVIRRASLQRSQFSPELVDDQGTFHIPDEWKKQGPLSEGACAR